MTERYQAYDAFARMYDRHWGKQSASHLDLLDETVLGRLPEGARVLDLCCGTGQLARMLCDRGLEVTGVDGSEEMVSYARRNAPQASFLVDDARSFDVGQGFDVVLCNFDSLNHIMSEEDLGAVFDRVAHSLRAGGTFAFDMNMEPKYLHTWTGEFSVVEDREVCVVRASVDPPARLAHFDATLFYAEESGGWSRHDVHLEQTWYSVETITQGLTDRGYGAPSIHVKQARADEPGVALNLLFVTRKQR